MVLQIDGLELGVAGVELMASGEAIDQPLLGYPVDPVSHRIAVGFKAGQDGLPSGEQVDSHIIADASKAVAAFVLSGTFEQDPLQFDGR